MKSVSLIALCALAVLYGCGRQRSDADNDNGETADTSSHSSPNVYGVPYRNLAPEQGQEFIYSLKMAATGWYEDRNTGEALLLYYHPHGDPMCLYRSRRMIAPSVLTIISTSKDTTIVQFAKDKSTYRLTRTRDGKVCSQDSKGQFQYFSPTSLTKQCPDCFSDSVYYRLGKYSYLCFEPDFYKEVDFEEEKKRLIQSHTQAERRGDSLIIKTNVNHILRVDQEEGEIDTIVNGKQLRSVYCIYRYLGFCKVLNAHAFITVYSPGEFSVQYVDAVSGHILPYIAAVPVFSPSGKFAMISDAAFDMFTQTHIQLFEVSKGISSPILDINGDLKTKTGYIAPVWITDNLIRTTRLDSSYIYPPAFMQRLPSGDWQFLNF